VNVFLPREAWRRGSGRANTKVMSTVNTVRRLIDNILGVSKQDDKRSDCWVMSRSYFIHSTMPHITGEKRKSVTMLERRESYMNNCLFG
jgi:hypothetical protein